MTIAPEIMAIIAVLGIAVAYPVIMRALAEAVHPYRLEMADLGRELVEQTGQDEKVVAYVRGCMRDALNWRELPVIGTAVFAAAINAAIGRGRFQSLVPKTAEDQGKLLRFTKLYVISITAANPIFGILFFIELLALIGVLRGVKRVKHILYGAMVDTETRHGVSHHPLRPS